MLSTPLAATRIAALMCTSCLGGRLVCTHTCICMHVCVDSMRTGRRLAWRAGVWTYRSARAASAALRSHEDPCTAVRTCVPAFVFVHVRICLPLCVRVCACATLCLCVCVHVCVCLSLCVCLSSLGQKLQEMLCLRNGDVQPLGISEFPRTCSTGL